MKKEKNSDLCPTDQVQEAKVFHFSDIDTVALLKMIREEYPKVWTIFYDKYSPLVYSIVYHLSGRNEIISEKIVTSLILELKNKSLLNGLEYNITSFLIPFTKQFTMRYLKNCGMELHPPQCEESLLNKMLYGIATPFDLQEKLQLNCSQLKSKLRQEFKVSTVLFSNPQ